MKLNEILHALHSSDNNKVLVALNKSLKIVHLSPQYHKTRNVIHSGFRFNLHSGTSVDLLIDLEPNDPLLLWQEVMIPSPLPSILGLRLTLEGKNHKKILDSFMVGRSFCNTEMLVLPIYDVNKLDVDHTYFKVYEKSLPNKFTAFPLSREFPIKLYYGRQGFTLKAENHKDFDSIDCEFLYQENQYFNHHHDEEDRYSIDDMIF